MSTSPEREAFETFYHSQEVDHLHLNFVRLLAIIGCNPEEDKGLSRYAKLRDAIFGSLSFRQKSIFKLLDDAITHRSKLLQAREAQHNRQFPTVDDKTKRANVLISGAGPTGLRAAVECVLLGMNPVVVEKRANFSRANILLLWQYTGDDLFYLGAKFFYPEWNRHGSIHMGTREIQLCLLKTALILGIDVFYQTQLVSLVPNLEKKTWVAVAAPTPGSVESEKRISKVRLSVSKRLSAIQRKSASKDRINATALDFKPNKMGDYSMTFTCNMIQNPETDMTFFVDPKIRQSKYFEFDSLIVAEGESSQTSTRLGFKKSVDKFKQAIGMVINLAYDKSNLIEKKLQQFTVSKLKPTWVNTPLGKLDALGIKCEMVEYLRGVTHYIVLTVEKESLLEQGVVLEDKPSLELLSSENVDFERLKDLARTVAMSCGLPESTPFFHSNPVQIFDFSSRARNYEACKSLVASPSGEIEAIDLKKIYFMEGENPYEGYTVAPVFPIGDALTEPFWPQGLGTNRGFHGALDAAFATLCFEQEGLKPCMIEREFAFSCMNTLSWTNPKAVLIPQNLWTTDYCERYSPYCLEYSRQFCKRSGHPVPDRVWELTIKAAVCITEAPGWNDDHREASVKRYGEDTSSDA